MDETLKTTIKKILKRGISKKCTLGKFVQKQSKVYENRRKIENVALKQNLEDCKICELFEEEKPLPNTNKSCRISSSKE